MTTTLALLLLLLKPGIIYTLHVNAADLSGWTVEMQVLNPRGTFRLAMAAHPEYDDRYWRYVTDFAVVTPGGSFAKVDSAVWQVAAPPGRVIVRYRIALPPAERLPRAAWRPFLTPIGGLVGGPHAFMYLLGGEHLPVAVILDLPDGWDIATGLRGVRDRTFMAPNAAALIDSPILAGRLRSWRFTAGGVPHRIVYWPLADAAAFDTAAFVAGIKGIAEQTIALFGRAPYSDYTFQFQDGAYGGLEHTNSVTLGARSSELARDPNAVLSETAHEFFHTWNLMAISPVEYRDVDYRTQPPVSSLWFSEGLTMFYADALLRRAGLPVRDSTREAHLERLIASYAGNPAYTRFSAESISRVAYNAPPGALGDYGASTHLQGEVIGAMLDFTIRGATRGRRSMDDVMRLLYDRAGAGERLDGGAVERAVEQVCACDVTPFFDAHVRGAATMDFNRYLGLAGMTARIDSAPAVYNGEPERDLRIFGWEPGDSSVRLVITNPRSLWGRAGLHSGDRVLRMDGTPVATWPDLRARLQRLRMGDTVHVAVERAAGTFEATVVVAGFERPVVRIGPSLSAAPPASPRK